MAGGFARVRYLAQNWKLPGRVLGQTGRDGQRWVEMAGVKVDWSMEQDNGQWAGDGESEMGRMDDLSRSPLTTEQLRLSDGPWSDWPPREGDGHRPWQAQGPKLLSFMTTPRQGPEAAADECQDGRRVRCVMRRFTQRLCIPGASSGRPSSLRPSKRGTVR